MFSKNNSQNLKNMSLDKFVQRRKRKIEETDKGGEETDREGEKPVKITRKLKLGDEEPDITTELKWRKLTGENLNCDCVMLSTKDEADQLFKECSDILEYNTGHLAKVKVFGKWHDIPRKQVAYGDSGLSYKFSNTTVPARPWIPFLKNIRDKISGATGYDFNFVLINRYKDGCDYIGEHRDDKADLVCGHPIASLSLGQPRDFIFRHIDARGKHAKRDIDVVKIELQHGALLMMNNPTNTYWYHSLPQRKKLRNVRINMTFRKMKPQAKRDLT